MVRLVRSDRPRAPDYTSRRVQFRLLLLFVPLALVILAMRWLRDPAVANRMDLMFTPSAAESEWTGNQNQLAPLRSPNPASIETKVHPAEQPLQSKTAVGNIDRFPGVEPEQLASITDNSYFRQAEQAAWFAWFELLKNATAEALSPTRAIDVDWVQLTDQPNYYRGRLVNVRGFIRQVTEQTPAENTLGIKKYYSIVLQPTDGTNRALLVYCLDLPPGLSVGELPGSRVAAATGLFFKKLSHAWSGRVDTAPVIVANTVEMVLDQGLNPHVADVRRIAEAESATLKSEAETSDDLNAPITPSLAPFPKVLSIAGWDEKRLEEFDDGMPLSDSQRIQALELLRRLRSFATGDLDAWANVGLKPDDAGENPSAFRGQLANLAGHVTNVTRHELSARDAQRLEMPYYYECKVMLKGGQAAMILAPRVPPAWLAGVDLNEPFSAVALYLKTLPNSGNASTLWLAKEIAWHPTNSGDSAHIAGNRADGRQALPPSDPSLGKNTLGGLGVDIGLLDEIQPRGPIRPEEADVFYQILRAAGSLDAEELAQQAQHNLPAAEREWEARLKESTTPAESALALEAIRHAKSGRYSVAPLFNDAPSQLGRLFVFNGVVNRALRVAAAGESDDDTADAAKRFGLQHYYQLDVFTADSQDNRLVFCVRELPEGFPTGERLSVPVRIAGFFLKDWLYRASGHAPLENADDTSRPAQRKEPLRYAPLLIGPAPLVLPREAPRSATAQYVGAAIFLLGLAGAAAAAVIYSRGDRRFRQQTQAATFAPPSGESLNNLSLDTPRVSTLPTGQNPSGTRDG